MIEKKNTTIYQLDELIKKYGSNVTLEEVKNELLQETPYKCPVCDGKGTVEYTYKSYPNGRPEMWWTGEEDFEVKKSERECELCHGLGYTKDKYTAKMEQTGWKKDEFELE